MVRSRTLLFLTVLGGLWPYGLGAPVKAVEFSDGSRHFVGVPRLEKVSTTHDRARSWGGRYYFTLQIPEDASEPLGRIEIQQQEGADRFERFDWSKTVAYLNGDRKLSVKAEVVALDQQARSVAIAFDPPVAPGTQLTLSLSPIQTPSAGIYLFGVTVFPAGEQGVGQFVGYGRLHFYDNRDWGPLWR